MLARILRPWASSMVLLPVLLLAWGETHGGGAGWWALAALFALGALPTLTLQFALLGWFGRDPAVAVPSVGRRLAALFTEWRASTRVFAWQQAFRAAAVADVAPRRGDAGLVLVHGFLCNRGLWNRWLERFTRDGRPVTALTLEPPFGSIDAYLPTLDAAVRRMADATGRPVTIVAHSMGGLVSRAWLAAAGAEGEARVHRIVTLGTPHGGTWLARFAFSTNGREMGRASRWLLALAERTAPTQAAKFVCAYSNLDNIVFPATTAVLPGSEAHHLDGVGHIAMVDDPRAWALVEAALASVPPAGVEAPTPSAPDEGPATAVTRPADAPAATPARA